MRAASLGETRAVVQSPPGAPGRPPGRARGWTSGHVAGLGLATAALLGYLALLAALGGPEAMAIGPLLAPFALPGMALAVRARLAHRADAVACLVLAGLPMGVIPCAIVAAWTGVEPTAMAVVLLAVGLFCLRLGPRPRCRLSRWRPADSLLLGAALLAVVAAVAWPILRVGTPTARGIAYTAYFDYDMLQHLAVAGAVAKGVPVANPYVAGETLHYYWLFHLVPAFVWRSLAGFVDMRVVFHGAATALAMVFTAGLYAVLRSFAGRTSARALALFLGLAAYSYKDLFLVVRPAAERILGDLARAPSSGVQGAVPISPLSHGYLRDFLYEPHALAATGVVVAALWAMRTMRVGPWLAAAAAVVAAGLDAFVGAIAGLWAVGSVLLGPPPRVAKGMAAGLVLAVGGAVYLGTAFFGPLGGGVRIEPYWRLVAFLPAYVPLEYGPMALLAGACCVMRGRHGRAMLPGPVVALALAALGAQLLLGVEGEEHMFLRKGVKVGQVALLALSGLAADRLLVRLRAGALAAAALVVLAAVPTLAVDVAAHSAVEDPTRTTYLDPRDLAACSWLESNTPEGAVVLTLPCRDDYSLVPSFALRTLYVGNAHHAVLFRNDRKQAVQRAREAEGFFRRPDAGFLRERGIHYVVADSEALRRCSEGVVALGGLEGLRPVFEDGGATVYEVTP